MLGLQRVGTGLTSARASRCLAHGSRGTEQGFTAKSLGSSRDGSVVGDSPPLAPPTHCSPDKRSGGGGSKVPVDLFTFGVSVTSYHIGGWISSGILIITFQHPLFSRNSPAIVTNQGHSVIPVMGFYPCTNSFNPNNIISNRKIQLFVLSCI